MMASETNQRTSNMDITDCYGSGIRRSTSGILGIAGLLVSIGWCDGGWATAIGSSDARGVLALIHSSIIAQA